MAQPLAHGDCARPKLIGGEEACSILYQSGLGVMIASVVLCDLQGPSNSLSLVSPVPQP